MSDTQVMVVTAVALGTLLGMAITVEAVIVLTHDVAAQLKREHHNRWRGTVALHLIKGDI